MLLFNKLIHVKDFKCNELESVNVVYLIFIMKVLSEMTFHGDYTSDSLISRLLSTESDVFKHTA